MGAALGGNPVDADTKREIEETIQAVLKTFTTQYSLEYLLALVQFLKEEARAKPEEPYELMERPPWSKEYKEGYMQKEGGIRKSWKKRYFVVRPNYSIDYYENEAESKKEKGKKKGTMSLCGYRVETDVNSGILSRLKQMAEKMGMSTDDLPKPKEYPEFTIELHHHRRRCYFVKCENKEDFDSWVDILKTACWRAQGWNNEDSVHQGAFGEAVRKTRWELGRWGWWSFGGSEDQILSDLISDQLDWAVMGKVYSKISGPWAVRNTIRNKVLQTIDKAVFAAVKPAWAAMEAAVKKIREEMEPTIKGLVDPIATAETEVIEKIKNAVMSQIEPALGEHVTPHLGKIMEVIKAPMSSGYDEAWRIFEEVTGKLELAEVNSKEALEKTFDSAWLDWYPRSYRMWSALDKLYIMYDPLAALSSIFPDIWPYWTIYNGCDELRKRMDGAIYTFEQLMLQAVEKGESAATALAAVQQQVKEKWLVDIKRSIVEWIFGVFKNIIMPPFQAVVVPLCKALLTPLDEAIPEPVKKFVDIFKLFDELLNGVVDDSIKLVLNA